MLPYDEDILYVSEPFGMQNQIYYKYQGTIIKQGPKYVFPVKPNLKSTIPGLETIVQSVRRKNKENFHNIMFHELNKSIKQPTVLEHDELNVIKI